MDPYSTVIARESLKKKDILLCEVKFFMKCPICSSKVKFHKERKIKKNVFEEIFICTQCNFITRIYLYFEKE